MLGGSCSPCCCPVDYNIFEDVETLQVWANYVFAFTSQDDRFFAPFFYGNSFGITILLNKTSSGWSSDSFFRSNPDQTVPPREYNFTAQLLGDVGARNGFSVQINRLSTVPGQPSNENGKGYIGFFEQACYGSPSRAHSGCIWRHEGRFPVPTNRQGVSTASERLGWNYGILRDNLLSGATFTATHHNTTPGEPEDVVTIPATTAGGDLIGLVNDCINPNVGVFSTTPVALPDGSEAFNRPVNVQVRFESNRLPENFFNFIRWIESVSFLTVRADFGTFWQTMMMTAPATSWRNRCGDLETEVRMSGVLNGEPLIGISDFQTDICDIQGFEQASLSFVRDPCDTVTLLWTPTQDRCRDVVDGYRLQFRVLGVNAWTTFGDVDGTATTGIITGLTEGVRYQFRVGRLLDNGNFQTFTGVVQSGFFPAVPTGVTTQLGSNPGEVDVAWNAVEEACFENTDYLVQFRVANTSTFSDFSRPASTDKFATVSGLSAGVTYVFRVRAINSVGNSVTFSSTSTITIPAG